MTGAGPTVRQTLLPPLLTGVGFAVGRAIGKGPDWGGLYWQSPFTFAFLSGVMISLALRPLLVRVAWRRDGAALMALAVLLGMGPVAAWCRWWLGAAAGWAGMPFTVPPTMVPELLGDLLAAGLMGWLFRPRSGTIDPRNVAARWRRMRPRGGWGWRVAALGTTAVAIHLAVGGLDAWAQRRFPLEPLLAVNPWLRLTAAEGSGAAGGLLALGWLHGAVRTLPLLGVALVVRGTRLQTTLLYGMLLFVVGEFAPLVEQQPFPSPNWLALRVVLGALHAGLLGWAAARLVGEGPLVPPSGGSRP